MNCDVCKKDIAVFHLTQITHGQKINRHLCKLCASKETEAAGPASAVLSEFILRQFRKHRPDDR